MYFVNKFIYWISNVFRPSSFVCRLTLLLIFSLISTISMAKDLIAYSHLTDGYWQIWEMEADGSNKSQITYSQADKLNPTWAENGQKIVFRTHNGQLYIINKDGRNEQEIFQEIKNINNPYYSDITGEIII